MRLFKDVQGKGTYATAERAEKKMQRVMADCGVDFRYLIMATVDGRFAPVAVLRQEQYQYMAYLAGVGICVAG